MWASNELIKTSWTKNSPQKIPLPNFRALIVVVYHHSICIYLFLIWLSTTTRLASVRGTTLIFITLYVQVHADNKGKASVSRGTHNFLNISFKIQSTNESHRFSDNPHSIVKKIVCCFRKKIHIYRKGTSRIESFEEKVMCFLKTFAFLLFAF